MDTALRWDLPALMNEETRDGSPDTDAQLMLRFQAGDLRAFESLFWRHSRPLVNFAYRFVRSRETAEELAQEVFLRVHDAAPLYRAQAKFTTWLYRIATNVCLNELRRPRFRAVHQSLDASTTTPEERARLRSERLSRAPSGERDRPNKKRP